ncbi:MAG: transglycosylase domain-containing protein [Anaerolineae bacterium]|nr:transglycosylase domain-containing protein [Anaerolineae bacterium]
MGSVVQIIGRRRRRLQRRADISRQRTLWSVVIAVLLGVFVILPGMVVAVDTLSFYWTTIDNPALDRSNAAESEAGRVTELYDAADETLIYTLRSTTGDTDAWVDIDTLPPLVIDTALMAEDADFLASRRINALDMVVGLWRNWLDGTLPPDTSITGRLVRDVILPAADTQGGGDLNSVRAQEIVLIAEVERRYSHEEILEWHFNTSYYGNEAYGIEAAAQLYLGKRAVDLTLDEAALLAAIPSAPQYNPFNNEIAARGRQGDLLRLMRNSDRIDEATYAAASTRIAPIVRGNYLPQIAPEFTVYARRQAAAILDSLGYDGTRLVALGGLRVTTSLDLALYQQMTCALETALARASGTAEPVTNCPAGAFTARFENEIDGLPPDTGALILMDAQTGVIRAMVGGAASAEHAPGVLLQPFVYLNGFLGGAQTPGTMVYDIPNQFPGAQEGLIYSFSNPNQPFNGPMNLRDAMGSWRLPAAVSVAYRQGMANILQTAHSLGLNSLDEGRFDIMLLERGGVVSLLDVAYSLSVFSTLGDMRGVPVTPAARGYRTRDPVAVLRISDPNGGVLWEYDETAARTCATLDVCTPLLEPGAAYLVNDVLSDQETRWSIFGQGSPFDTSMPAAVISGTAGGGERHWTFGYSPDYVVGAVLYRADSQPVGYDTTTISAAAPLWHGLMEYVHARSGRSTASWERPVSVVDVAVCETSGLLPNGICPVVNEIFLDGTQPQMVDTYWQVVEINNQNGRLANVNTPPELRSEARFFVPPAGEVRDWWTANNLPLPPVEYDEVSRPQVFQTVRIARPQLFDYVGGQVEIYAEVDTEDILYVQMEYGQGVNPTLWLSIGENQTNPDPGRPLGVWDTRGLDGLYSLRLVAVMDDNSRESDAVQVTVDNQPPSVRVDSVEPGKIYRWPTDDAVVLGAQVEDNLKIDRVEFYYENTLLGADVSWPYSLDWQIAGLGAHTFTAIAFDSVGNQSSSQITVEVLRAGS